LATISNSELRGQAMGDIVVDTLIFVDVDGVLNVGVKDEDGGALAFSEKNLQAVLGSAQDVGPGAAKIRAVAERPIEQEKGATYKTLVADSAQVSRVLVARLAQILRAASAVGSRHVVLSSKWRSESRVAKVQHLETAITQHLDGKAFTFDDRTEPRNELNAMDRLETIGNYVEQFCTQRANLAAKLRILVLEDFFISALSGLSCQGFAIDSVGAVEEYLLSRTGSGCSTSVRVVHTYEELTGEDGLPLAIGCGLTMKCFLHALEFLGSPPGAGVEDSLRAGEYESESFQEGPKLRCASIFSHSMEQFASTCAVRLRTICKKT